MAISRCLIGVGSPLDDLVNGFFTLARQDAFLGILHCQVAATPPETMQATVPDGAEHEVSFVHCVSTVVMSHNLVDPSHVETSQGLRDDDFRTGLAPGGSCRPAALPQPSAAPHPRSGVLMVGFPTARARNCPTKVSVV